MKLIPTLALSDGSELPDLVLHCGSAAVPKYNNPDLIPGMYLTLFLAGVGGFDNSGQSLCAFIHEPGKVLSQFGR